MKSLQDFNQYQSSHEQMTTFQYDDNFENIESQKFLLFLYLANLITNLYENGLYDSL